jgi:hypothetical protein
MIENRYSEGTEPFFWIKVREGLKDRVRGVRLVR